MKVCCIAFIFLTTLLHAQAVHKFEQEIGVLGAKYDTVYSKTDQNIVFTGSSSVRMWLDLQERFQDKSIINTGFGGSKASDLSYYLYDLVLRFNPKKVFIYEGDNDLFAGIKPSQVRDEMRRIVKAIHRYDIETKVVLIAAKPSLARWNFRRKYRRLNRKFNRMAKRDPKINFADVWRPMLNDGMVKKDIFVADGLHMNRQGYDIWFEVLRPFIN